MRNNDTPRRVFFKESWISWIARNRPGTVPGPWSLDSKPEQAPMGCGCWKSTRCWRCGKKARGPWPWIRFSWVLSLHPKKNGNFAGKDMKHRCFFQALVGFFSLFGRIHGYLKAKTSRLRVHWYPVIEPPNRNCFMILNRFMCHP